MSTGSVIVDMVFAVLWFSWGFWLGHINGWERKEFWAAFGPHLVGILVGLTIGSLLAVAIIS